jgi:hypothetical protein
MDRERGRRRRIRAKAGRIRAREGARQQDKARREYSAAIEDVFRVYDIHVLRRELSKAAIPSRHFHAEKGRQAQTDDGKIMRHFGRWISESDHELVRAEAEAIDNLSFGLGLLARIHKGTVASYQRRKVNNEAWLPAQVTWTASARVLLVRHLRLRGISEFSKYRRFSVDTSTTIDPPR